MSEEGPGAFEQRTSWMEEVRGMPGRGQSGAAGGRGLAVPLVSGQYARLRSAGVDLVLCLSSPGLPRGAPQREGPGAAATVGGVPATRSSLRPRVP